MVRRSKVAVLPVKQAKQERDDEVNAKFTGIKDSRTQDSLSQVLKGIFMQVRLTNQKERTT